MLGCRSQVQFAVADRSTRAPLLVPKCAEHFLCCLCLLLPPGTGSGGQRWRRRPSRVGVDAAPLSPLRRVCVGTLEGAVRALRCGSAAAPGTADVQRAEMRLCMSGLYSEDLRSASCVSMCVHKRDLATFASVTIWMCMCAHVLLRR